MSTDTKDQTGAKTDEQVTPLLAADIDTGKLDVGEQRKLLAKLLKTMGVNPQSAYKKFPKNLIPRSALKLGVTPDEVAGDVLVTMACTARLYLSCHEGTGVRIAATPEASIKRMADHKDGVL